MKPAPRLHPLAHPATLAALAVLLANDRIWKAAAPSVWTGKLSDLAGLIVLPVLLCAVWNVATRRRAWAVHLGVGGVFAAMQFVDLGGPLAMLRAATGVVLAHTPDPTDLIALAVLPIGVALTLAPHRPVGRAVRIGALALSVVAVAGTSKPPEPALFEDEGLVLVNGREPDDAFDAIEAALAEADVEVFADSTDRRETVRDEIRYVDQLVHVRFEQAFPADSLHLGTEAGTPDTVRTVTGWLLLGFDLNHGGTRLIEDGDFEILGGGTVDRAALADAVRQRVLAPIAELDATLPGL